MFSLKRLNTVALLLTISCGLAAPALCGSTRPEAMPCCDPDRDCGAWLGRPSCCLDAPGDTDRTAAGKLDRVTKTPDAPGPPELAPAAGDIAAFTAMCPEPRAGSGEPPPLFLLHVSFLC